MKKHRKTITLLASTAALMAACDYNGPDGVRYATYDNCVMEWSDDYCEDGRDGFYYSHFYHSGGYVYGYNKKIGKYGIVPKTAGIYGNPNLSPTRALRVQVGGFGKSAKGISVGG
jgi:hypothetical protein